MVALVGLLGYAFLPASATARIVNLATNIGALLVFIPQGAPMWRLGLAMGACNVAGGWLGAHTAIRRGSGFVRVVFLTVVVALILRLGYDVLQPVIPAIIRRNPRANPASRANGAILTSW